MNTPHSWVAQIPDLWILEGAPHLPMWGPPRLCPPCRPDFLSLPFEPPGLCLLVLNTEGAVLGLRLHVSVLSVASPACPAVSPRTLLHLCPPPANVSCLSDGSSPKSSMMAQTLPYHHVKRNTPLLSAWVLSPSGSLLFFPIPRFTPPTPKGLISLSAMTPLSPLPSSCSPLPRLEGLPHLAQACPSVSFRGCSFPTSPPQKGPLGRRGLCAFLNHTPIKLALAHPGPLRWVITGKKLLISLEEMQLKWCRDRQSSLVSVRSHTDVMHLLIRRGEKCTSAPWSSSPKPSPSGSP